MPYIGNNHIAGDHTNNFKVLDDISSFTATFDGSATSVIDTTNNTIRVVEHRFIQGQRVTYTNGGGGNIGGLTTGTAYFVIFDSASTIKLATNASNAANSTAINLSAVGTGSSHTLNAAFDGVNTKFKLTHGSGTGARLNNATQINVAINNVLQRPNLDPNNFTDGFALEDNHKIVFQTAPTSEDIFWGSIIANTLTTFDISDHKIDTFTGDGSTTEFNLSHTPANNESLMVTINGVLQHPSNASTARAYTLIANVIQFTAAPGVGDEIQVRHLGFAGATTADVSGFYGRTGNVVLTSNDHITTGNINAGIVTATSFDGTFSSNIGGSNANFTGIVTAGTFKGGNIDAVDGAFSGNVTIGGTLTYEDVSNIDSVGIITAQKDIHVGAGLSVVGVSTLGTSGSVFLQHNGTTRLQTSSAGVLINGAAYIENNGSNIKAAGLGINNSIFHNGDENTAMDFSDNDRVRFRTNGTERLAITNTGIHFNVVGISTFVGNIDANGDLDVDGHTNLDNVSIAGVTTCGSIYSNTISLSANSDIRFASGSWSGNITKIQNHNNYLYIVGPSNGFQFRIGATDLWLMDSISNDGNFWPTVDSGRDIGKSTRRVRNVYATTLYGDGSNLTGITQTTINNNAANRIVTGSGTANTLTANSDLIWNGSRLDIDTGGTEDALRIGNTAGTDTFIRLGSISTSADTHAVLKYDKDDNYVSLLVSGESHGNGGILIANGGAVSLSAGTSPLAKLHVKEDIYVKGSTGDGSTGIQIRSGTSALSNQHQVRTGGGLGNMLILEASGSTGIFSVQTGNGGERFRITSGGYVNIGGNYTQTTHRLQVDGSIQATSNIVCLNNVSISGTAPQIIFTDTNQDADFTIKNDGGQLNFIDRTNSNTTRMYANAGGFGGDRLYISNDIVHTGDTDTKIEFETNTINFDTGGTERLRINSSGQVKIQSGTVIHFTNTNNDITTDTSDGSDNKRIVISGGGATDSSRGANINLTGNEYSGANGKLELSAGNSGNTNGSIDCYTGGSLRLKIASNGAVSMVTAGSLPATSNETLHVQGEGHNGHGTTNTRSVLNVVGARSSNSNAAGLWIGARTNENTAVIGTRTSSGNLAFETYQSGWYERMRIRSDGRILMGIGIPTSGYTRSTLHVESPGVDLRTDYDTDDSQGLSPHLTLFGSNAHVRLDMGTLDVGPYASYIQSRFDNDPEDGGTSNSGLEPLMLNPMGGPIGMNINTDASYGSGNWTGNTSPYGGLLMRAGRANSATVNNYSTAIKIYPAETRTTTVGEQNQGVKFGGIAWLGLDPHHNNGSWGGSYQGHNCWMGMSYHSTPGQEKANWQVQMNSSETPGSFATNVAIQANPEGYVTHPSQPYASTTLGNATSGNMIPHNTVLTNNGSHFNTSNSRFICPVNGFYLVSFMAMTNNSNDTMDIELRKNGSNANNILVPYQSNTGSNYNQVSGTCIIECAKNDYLQFKVNNGSIYSGRHSAQCFALLG